MNMDQTGALAAGACCSLSFTWFDKGIANGRPSVHHSLQQLDSPPPPLMPRQIHLGHFEGYQIDCNAPLC